MWHWWCEFPINPAITGWMWGQSKVSSLEAHWLKVKPLKENITIGQQPLCAHISMHVCLYMRMCVCMCLNCVCWPQLTEVWPTVWYYLGHNSITPVFRDNPLSRSNTQKPRCNISRSALSPSCWHSEEMAQLDIGKFPPSNTECAQNKD